MCWLLFEFSLGNTVCLYFNDDFVYLRLYLLVKIERKKINYSFYLSD